MEHIKVARVDKVFLRTSARDYGAEGTLHLTAHQLIFVSSPTAANDTSATPKEEWIFYSTIADVTRLPPPPPPSSGAAAAKDTPLHNIDILTRHFKFYRLTIPIGHLDAVYESLIKLVHIDSHDQFYAFAFYHSPDVPNTGWQWFDLRAEFARQGVGEGLRHPEWRVTEVNAEYGICATYPSVLAAPTSVLDTTLKFAAKHRSRGRLPALTYVHPTGASLTRCAQPLVGVNSKRSPQDERLVAMVFAQPIKGRPVAATANATAGDGAGAGVGGLEMMPAAEHLIVDARPAINAAANHVKGSGTENMEFYRGARKEYAPIDNIHVMRDSLARMMSAVQQSDTDSIPLTLTDLDKSSWLKHIKLLLEGTQLVIDTMVHRHAHVLVHCSDGWDRTSQLCALSQVCMDPYFRTMRGFAVLIEKDWLAFGHKFSDRCGHLTPKAADHALAQGLVKSLWAKVENTVEQREISPVFHQFLDCVFQLMCTYPDAFEFNEDLLLELQFQVYACKFGTFLLNSERERREATIRDRTHSVWSMVEKERARFLNPAYVPPSAAGDHLPLPLSCRIPKLRYWTRLITASSHGAVDPDTLAVDFASMQIAEPTLPSSSSSSSSTAIGIPSASTSPTGQQPRATDASGPTPVTAFAMDPSPSSSFVSTSSATAAALGTAVVGGVRGLLSRWNAASPPLASDTLSVSADPLGHRELDAISVVSTTRGSLRASSAAGVPAANSLAGADAPGIANGSAAGNSVGLL